MEEFGPWKRRSCSQRYDNPWITVEHHEVLTPRGTEGVYGVVHFKNIAIGIIPLDEQQHTWLVGQYRYPHRAYSWEVPEGGGPVGQDPLQSAQRELAEEAGYAADRLVKLCTFDTSKSILDETAHLYVAEGLRAIAPTPDDTEFIEVRAFPFAEVVRMVEQSEITDAMTALAVLHASRARLNVQSQRANR